MLAADLTPIFPNRTSRFFESLFRRDLAYTPQKPRNVERRPTVKTIVLLIMIALGAAPMSAAQTLKSKPDPKAPAPRLPNGKPDLSGLWNRPGTQDMTRTFTNANGTSNKGEPNPLPFTTWGQAQWDNYDQQRQGDYAGSCMPFGWIRSFTPHPMQILQNNEYISFLFEQSTMFQIVNTEGLPHRKDWTPTWFGDSRGRWEGDTLVIEAVNFNGWAKLGTIGHPMSDKAKLTMYFSRPSMGRMEFKWVLDDPKTYTRPISNERVFVLTPEVELMEYSCMEGNLSSLLEGAISPWTGPKDSDTNLVYGTTHDWPTYDLTKAQKLTGVLKELAYRGKPPQMKIEVDKRLLTVILAPPSRMEFRDLTEDLLKIGGTVTVVAYPSKTRQNEFRAETLTLGKTTTDLR
jgi:hypothetical protein